MTAMSVVHAMASQALVESFQCLWLRFCILLLMKVNIIIKMIRVAPFIVLDFNLKIDVILLDLSLELYIDEEILT